MKVGDKVTCLKDNRLCFKTGLLYTVDKIYQDRYVIYGHEYDIISKYGYQYNFDKYLMSLKDERKFKLKKIYDTILDS